MLQLALADISVDMYDGGLGGYGPALNQTYFGKSRAYWEELAADLSEKQVKKFCMGFT